MALAAGHEVVHLPVAHCMLNPIELAWGQVKGHIKANTSKFTLNEAERLAKEGFEVVTKERWADLVKHVRDKVKDHYWQDNLDLDEHFRVSEFVIHVGSESDDASSELNSASDSSICLSDAVVAIDSDEDT
uniref:Tc1-like transposase DDE domain-containing protein n=1 Tax=Amphimedon queenslandica TaxID=400682 RepID=A0A1X7V968_AMPQE